MAKIDSEGTFVGTIEEAGLTLTNKNKYPQAVFRLKAVKKFVADLDGMKHFGIEEPAYVDWSSFEEDIVAYLMLFKSASEFNDDTKMLNYEQIMLATGWDGRSFDQFADGTFVGKLILFRVQQDSYTNPDTGKEISGLKVTWIDSESANPERALKTLASDEVKNLSALLMAGGLGGIKTAKPAKPSSPAKPSPAAKPAAGAATTKTSAPAAPAAAATSGATAPAASSTPASTPATSPAASPASAPAKPKAPPAGKKKAATPPPPPPAEESTGLPAEATQGEAWEHVCNNKGDNDDAAIEDAWIAACGEVLENRGQDEATPKDWAKIRDVVIKDLAL